MEDLKIIVGKNLSSLRKARKMTQAELADKFNYSDKAISKWEQGATLPDIETLKQLCDFYGVTLDYLTKEENIEAIPTTDGKKETAIFINRIITSCLLALIIWMIATMIFVYPLIFQEGQSAYWPVFIWAATATALLVIILNFIFFKKNPILSFIAWTVFAWSAISAVYLHFLVFNELGKNMWPIFLIGAPLQMIFILWFIIRKKVIK